jgi:hypothetical protein
MHLQHVPTHLMCLESCLIVSEHVASVRSNPGECCNLLPTGASKPGILFLAFKVGGHSLGDNELEAALEVVGRVSHGLLEQLDALAGGGGLGHQQTAQLVCGVR